MSGDPHPPKFFLLLLQILEGPEKQQLYVTAEMKEGGGRKNAFISLRNIYNYEVFFLKAGDVEGGGL